MGPRKCLEYTLPSKPFGFIALASSQRQTRCIAEMKMGITSM
jgi:hypothetical protein